MSGADTLVDAEGAVRDYLASEEVNLRLTNSGDSIKVYEHEFNSDAPDTCIKVVASGGSGDKYLVLDYPLVRV